MIGFRLILVVLALIWNANKWVVPNSGSEVLWTVNLTNALLPTNEENRRVPEHNKSCGIARWDDDHVLIYYLQSGKNLVRRTPDKANDGSWSFSVMIVNIYDGKVERSATIPAGSMRSEIVLAAGGLIISDPDRLVFYSRSLEMMPNKFQYIPLHPPVPTLHGLSSDPEHLYVTPDRKTVVLVDVDGRRSHMYVFDGLQLLPTADWLVNNAGQDMSIGETGLLYRGFDDAKNVYWTSFDGRTTRWGSAALNGQTQVCVIPVYVSQSASLNVCGSPELLTLQKRYQLYQLQKNERTELPTVVSPDKRVAAIFKETFRGGGALDATEQRVAVHLLVVSLDEDHSYVPCQIPIVPLPHNQITVEWLNDNTLAILHDGAVSAYRITCFN